MELPFLMARILKIIKENILKTGRYHYLSLAPALALIAACSPHAVNTDPAPVATAGQGYSETSTAAPERSSWYDRFNDPALTTLVNTALNNNLDIRAAIARLSQAQAVSTQSRSALFPSVDIEADSEKQWEDGDAQEGESRIGAALSWEVDAFGRLSSALTSSRFEERAAAEDVEAVRLGISAEVAEAYYSAVAQQLLLKLLAQQTQTDRESLDLIQQRLDAGVGTNVEVLQQKSQLADNESLIPPAQANLRVFENRLDVLVAQAPDARDRTIPDKAFDDIGTLPAIGVPSELLLNRPDLRALKNRLVAADADIAAAVADRLPRVTLDGSFIFADTALSPVASILAGLVQPLLDWGRRKAEVERNEALYEEQLSQFTQAYLVAVEDVENALYRENRQREFIDRLETRRLTLSQSYDAAQAIYKQGESDYLPVLDSLQNLRAVERALVTERLNLILIRIQLYRALGGPVMIQTTQT